MQNSNRSVLIVGLDKGGEATFFNWCVPAVGGVDKKCTPAIFKVHISDYFAENFTRCKWNRPNR